jgi:hypothetical protein
MKLRTSMSELINELIAPDEIDITTEKPQEYALERNTKPIEDIKSEKPGMPIGGPQMINTLKKWDLKPFEKAIENVQQIEIGLTAEKIEFAYAVEGLSYRDVMNGSHTNDRKNAMNEKLNSFKNA